MSAEESPHAPVFKKRAKTTFTRKRDSEDEDRGQSPPRSVSEILKYRRQGRARKPPATRATEPGQDDGGRGIVEAQVAVAEQTEADKMAARFVPQTGQVMDTYDKQLNAYVEAKMAEYRGVSANPPPFSTAAPGTSAHMDRDVRDRPPDKQAATAGKLMEIDLPEGQTSHRAPSPPREKLPRMRVGRDGKLYRPKPRRRRNSADLARDQAVEGILMEAPLSLFGGAGANTQDPAGTTGGEAQEVQQDQDEEEVVERFRREWREAPERRRRRPPAGPPGKTQKESKGPRMGGTKNARRPPPKDEKK